MDRERASEAALHEYDALREEIRLHKASFRQHQLLLAGAGAAVLATVGVASPIAGAVALALLPFILAGFFVVFLNDHVHIQLLGRHVERLERHVNALVGVTVLRWESEVARRVWRPAAAAAPRRGELVAYPVLLAAYVVASAIGTLALWPLAPWGAIAYAIVAAAGALLLARYGWASWRFLRPSGGMDAVLDEAWPPGAYAGLAP